ncbi:MAG TPA: FtsQ-type POTRA domain-containing protein [Ornithinibacter sp.]|nr:FtsQ-type POTRA domain-containing protein [Ornithinibacter sp.]
MSGTRPATQDRPAVLGAPSRFAERPRADRRRRWRRRGLGAAAVLVFSGVVWALGWSDLLGVRTIEVVGEQRASEGLVRLTSDVEAGVPLARVDTAAVERRVGELRVVAAVRAERVWPHTLRITVVERQPVTVARRADSLRLLDAEGVDYATVQSLPRGLPTFDVDLDTTSPEAVAAGLSVIQTLPPSLARRVAAVEVTSPDDVRLRLRSGAVVLWGDALAGEQKAAVLAALLSQRADRYDVRAPDAPTTRG